MWSRPSDEAGCKADSGPCEELSLVEFVLAVMLGDGCWMEEARGGMLVVR